jgi:hypothetical protein
MGFIIENISITDKIAITGDFVSFLHGYQIKYRG